MAKEKARDPGQGGVARRTREDFSLAASLVASARPLVNIPRTGL
jgi:hypothetical protein